MRLTAGELAARLGVDLELKGTTTAKGRRRVNVTDRSGHPHTVTVIDRDPEPSWLKSREETNIEAVRARRFARTV